MNISDLLLHLQVDIDLLVLLLYLPIITTLIGLARYILGIKTLGIYAPILMTFMFYEFGFNNETFYSSPLQAFKLGLPLILIIVFITIFAYKILRKVSMHYYSKLALVISTITIALILWLLAVNKLGYPGFINLNIFSLILITTLSERFMHLIAFNKSGKKALYLALETIFLSGVIYLFISIHQIQTVLLHYPAIILLIFPINYFIGKFTGLRLTEYYRFREVLDSEE